MNAKIGVFSGFFGRFRAARHISRANCTEIRDIHGQAAHEIFSIEHRFRQSKSRFSRFKEMAGDKLTVCEQELL